MTRNRPGVPSLAYLFVFFRNRSRRVEKDCQFVTARRHAKGQHSLSRALGAGLAAENPPASSTVLARPHGRTSSTRPAMVRVVMTTGIPFSTARRMPGNAAGGTLSGRKPRARAL